MKLKALSPVSHDGQEIAEGQQFEVKSDEQAAALLTAGAAEEVKPTKKPAKE